MKIDQAYFDAVQPNLHLRTWLVASESKDDFNNFPFDSTIHFHAGGNGNPDYSARPSIQHNTETLAKFDSEADIEIAESIEERTNEDHEFQYLISRRAGFSELK